MDYISKNDYDLIMYDALNENGTLVLMLKAVLSFFGVPMHVIERTIKVVSSLKMVIYIMAILVLIVICGYLIMYKATNVLLIAAIFLLEYYFRTNAII